MIPEDRGREPRNLGTLNGIGPHVESVDVSCRALYTFRYGRGLSGSASALLDSALHSLVRY